MFRALPVWMGLVGAVICWAGCSRYVADYEFFPRPAQAVVQTSVPGQTPPVTAWAYVAGVRKGDKKEGVPLSVEVHLQVENSGTGRVTFDPGTLALQTGTFASFGPPLVQPAGVMALGPGQSGVVTAYFPFPAGLTYRQVDLASLMLRWQVEIEGQPVRETVQFQRALPAYYYDPYYPYGYQAYGPTVGLGLGFGWGRGHWGHEGHEGHGGRR